MREERILVEDQSFSTVSNARFTRDLLPEAAEVIVVTSRDHVHRAVVDFTLAFGPDARVAGVGAPNDPPTVVPGTRGDYLDVMKWCLGRPASYRSPGPRTRRRVAREYGLDDASRTARSQQEGQ